MFVITADQHDSRTSEDLVPDALDEIARLAGSALLLPPERTAGDEVQALIRDADAALTVALALTRTEQWSVGVGIGRVEDPLPDNVRAARGSAFLAARDAVDAAKRRRRESPCQIRMPRRSYDCSSSCGIAAPTRGGRPTTCSRAG